MAFDPNLRGSAAKPLMPGASSKALVSAARQSMTMVFRHNGRGGSTPPGGSRRGRILRMTCCLLISTSSTWPRSPAYLDPPKTKYIALSKDSRLGGTSTERKGAGQWAQNGNRVLYVPRLRRTKQPVRSLVDSRLTVSVSVISRIGTSINFHLHKALVREWVGIGQNAALTDCSPASR